LKAAINRIAPASIKGQLKTDEHLVGDTQCKYTVTSDFGAGDRATTVTITVLAKCTAEAST
jgi:hypothetical protein